MNRIDRFNNNLQKVYDKYNDIKLIDDKEYFKYTDKVKWFCNKHNIDFISSLHILLDKRVTCGCPICKNDKLYTSSIKGVEIKKQLKDL